MKKIIGLKLIALILLSCTLQVFGITNEEMEQELVGQIKKIKKMSGYNSSAESGSLEQLGSENKIFEAKLLLFAKRSTTLKYQFKELDKYIHIATSDDGKFRTYSWDTETGGTMHFYGLVYQFQNKRGRTSSRSAGFDEGDPGGFVSDIFTLGNKGKSVYIVRSTSVLSTSQAVENVELFSVADIRLYPRRDALARSKTANLKGIPAVVFVARLRQEKLIKMRSRITNTLGFQYDFFSVAGRKERPIKLAGFDKSTKTIKIPIVIKNKKFPHGEVTNRLIKYRFNGVHFVKVKR